MDGIENRLAIVIPTYNERENIRKLLVVLSERFPALRILVVDDSSPDGTASVVAELSREKENIRLLLRDKKTSMSSAYIDAFARIIPDDSIDYVLTMDADLSHNPDDVPKLLRAVSNGSDIAIGSRYVKGGKIENWALWRLLISKYGSVYTRIVTGLPVQDVTAGFVLYSKQALMRILPNIREREQYAFQTEMKYLAFRSKLSMSEVPITFRERTFGKSKLKKQAILEALFFPWYLRLFK